VAEDTQKNKKPEHVLWRRFSGRSFPQHLKDQRSLVSVGRPFCPRKPVPKAVNGGNYAKLCAGRLKRSSRSIFAVDDAAPDRIR
jgi:hypothetical protein